MPTSSTNPADDARFDALRARVAAAVRAAADLDAPGFVDCDLLAVRRALTHIAAEGLAPGRVFCEWGSGVGAVATLAASMSFQAHGIEIHAGLVDLARGLAAESDVEVRFVAASFLQTGDEDIASTSRHLARTVDDDAYRRLGLDVADVDVVFAYPWPGDEHVFDALFLRRARPAALLVTFHGAHHVLVQRHVGDGLATVLRT